MLLEQEAKSDFRMEIGSKEALLGLVKRSPIQLNKKRNINISPMDAGGSFKSDRLKQY